MWVDDGTLGEAGIRSTSGREIGVQFRCGICNEVKTIHIGQVLVITLAGENEKHARRRF
jgi:hypothetical protein